MLRICEKRGDRRIGLARAKLQVCVLGIPTGESRVMLRYGLIGISSRSTRRVQVQMILEDFEIHLLNPWLEESGLPKPCQMISSVSAVQILNQRILSVGGIGAKRRWRPKPEIRGVAQHPWLPGAGERRYRVRARPDSRHRGIGARELRIRSVLLRICDNRLANVFPQVEPRTNITRKRDSGHHAGHRRLVRRIRKLRGLIWEEIRQDGCGGPGRYRMLRRIRRALRHRRVPQLDLEHSGAADYMRTLSPRLSWWHLR